MPNRLSQFWQELKRRKVIHVITVYAGAAFVIIELINNITEPLRLPEWTPTLFIVILLAGFPLVVIFSWIYDVKPKEGIVKTEPVEKVQPGDIPKSSSSWKIASYISFVVIVSLIVLNIIPRIREAKEVLDKSIAVLPFRNESSDEENAYFINGTMEAILDNLCKIEDLRVPGRTSMEQYRDMAKAIPVIAEEMNVSYVLEGSGQKIGDRILLTVQLLDGKKDQHLWSKQYDRNIESMEDLIDIQSEIARLIAGEVKAIIKPDEEELMSRLPTTSMTAYDLYLKANEYKKEYVNTLDLGSYQTAVNLYLLSLETDSTFALAYTGLAWTYMNRYFWPEYFTEDFLDSCLVMVDMALSIDDKLEEAYYLKGLYFEQNGIIEKAINNYNNVIEINPNYYFAYLRKGSLLSTVLAKNVEALENYHKALTLVGNEARPSLLETLGGMYAGLGFSELAKEYYRKTYAMNGNQVAYLVRMGWLEFGLENYEEALRLMKEANQLDSTFLFNLHFYLYSSGQHYQEAYELARKWIARSERTGAPIYFQSHRIGYIYYKLGRFEEAEAFFQQQINYSEKSIRLSRFYSQGKAAQYDLAATLAFQGKKEEAYRRMDEFNTLGYFNLGMISFVKNDPLFESIHNEDRFQKIVQDMEAKHRAEHERVRQWMEKNGML